MYFNGVSLPVSGARERRERSEGKAAREQGRRGAGAQGARHGCCLPGGDGGARWRVTGIAGNNAGAGERKAVQTSTAVVIAKTLVYI